MRIKQFKSYFIQTFGCAQNTADSERIKSYLNFQGLKEAKIIYQAEYVVVNTCMIRQMAEDRIYGILNNLSKNKKTNGLPKKIVLTGCMVGLIIRDKTGKYEKHFRKKISRDIELIPIEEIGFDYSPKRSDKKHALVPISNGCNNFCTFCVVPYTRGAEVSRPYHEIISECQKLQKEGCNKITLLGMNVNSYGSDLIKQQNYGNTRKSYENKYFQKTIEISRQTYKLDNGENIKPVFVKHLGRMRIPTLFPVLLENIAKNFNFKLIEFLSSNPWDFSDELITVIKKYKNISRNIHLPVQSGSNSVLKRMNRWYKVEDYIELFRKLKKIIPEVKISTDIIVGFCGETDKEFQQTVDLAKKVKFSKAYIAMYSDRPMTYAHKSLKDDIDYKSKKERWKILDKVINSTKYNG